MSYWTYRDLGEVFGLSADVVKKRMRAWEADGFPAPLPWSRRDKRWDPATVLRWKARRELRVRATEPAIVGDAA